MGKSAGVAVRALAVVCALLGAMAGSPGSVSGAPARAIGTGAVPDGTTSTAATDPLLPDAPGYLQLWSAANQASDWRTNPLTEAQAVAAAQDFSVIVVANDEMGSYEAAMHEANPGLR
ncbi:MAG TPA: hypothetical protein VMF60_06335, partial [Acidimicrobiales bacterium]|nr:hypothetical protein [Acidimicrobiales bacterium]